jgi:hypothetical protein
VAIPRRRLLQALSFAGGIGATADAQDSDLSVEALRSVSMSHGRNLNDERLRVLKPVLERRRAQLRALRSFEVDDAVGL